MQLLPYDECMANVTYLCPQCDATVRHTIIPGQPVNCSACHWTASENTEGVEKNKMGCCLVCGGREMFIRKDFPQRLGVTILVVGFAASFVTWYFHWVIATFAILFGTALIDAVLFIVMGNVLECYRCKSQFRDIPQLEGHDAFDLEIHERYRQQSARMKQASRQQAEPTSGE